MWENQNENQGNGLCSSSFLMRTVTTKDRITYQEWRAEDRPMSVSSINCGIEKILHRTKSIGGTKIYIIFKQS